MPTYHIICLLRKRALRESFPPQALGTGMEIITATFYGWVIRFSFGKKAAVCPLVFTWGRGSEMLLDCAINQKRAGHGFLSTPYLLVFPCLRHRKFMINVVKLNNFLERAEPWCIIDHCWQTIKGRTRDIGRGIYQCKGYEFRGPKLRGLQLALVLAYQSCYLKQLR